MLTEAASEQGLLGNINFASVSLIQVMSNTILPFTIDRRTQAPSKLIFCCRVPPLSFVACAFLQQEQGFLRWLPVKTSIFPLILLERQNGRDLDLSIRISRSA